MKSIIQPEIFELFPDLQIGLVLCNNVNNQGQQPEIKNLIHQAEEQVKQQFAEMKPSDHPTIKAWRQAYTAFGGSSDYRSSVEALVKRTVKDRPLWTINKLVDLYNYISLKYLLPVGGEDLDRVEGDIQLKRALGSEEFVPLGEAENDSPIPGEVVYTDNKGVLCRRFNWREADRTKLTEKTKRAVIVMEVLLPEEQGRLKQATEEFSQLTQKYCQAETKIFFLDKQQSGTELSF